MNTINNLRARIVGKGFTLKSAVVDGAAAATNIAVSGIKTSDVIFGAYLTNPHPGVAAAAKIFKDDLLDEVSIPADGFVKFSTTATNGTNEQVLLLWFSAA